VFGHDFCGTAGSLRFLRTVRVELFAHLLDAALAVQPGNKVVRRNRWRLIFSGFDDVNKTGCALGIITECELNDQLIIRLTVDFESGAFFFQGSFIRCLYSFGFVVVGDAGSISCAQQLQQRVTIPTFELFDLILPPYNRTQPIA